MDSVVLISLIGILESCKPLLNRDNGLQIWARRHKSSSSASEISIPHRDSKLLQFMKTVLTLAHPYSIPIQFKFLNGLPMLNLLLVLLFKRWDKSTSPATEIRCHRCLNVDTVLTDVVWISYFIRMSVAYNTNTLPTLLSYFNDKNHHAQIVNGTSTAWFFINSWNFLI